MQKAYESPMKDQVIQNHNNEEGVYHEVSTLLKEVFAKYDLLGEGTSVSFKSAAPEMLHMMQWMALHTCIHWQH